MSTYPATERRTKPRQAASLSTNGLSLEELALLLEIAPRGWTEEEALGLVRRVAAQVCSMLDEAKAESVPQAQRWKSLASGREGEIREILDQTQVVRSDPAGDGMIARIAKLLRCDLDELHQAGKASRS